MQNHFSSQVYYQNAENRLRVVLERTYLHWKPHFQPSIEVVYLRSGSSTVLIDTKEYRLEPDDLLIVFPQQIHSYHDDNNPDCMVMFVPLDFVPLFRDQFCCTLPTDPVLRGASRFPHLLELFPHIQHAASHTGPHSNEILQGYLAAFFGQLLEQLTLETTGDIEYSIVHTILRYCTAHCYEPLNIQSLSEALHLNRSYLSAVFSQQLHISLSDYLNALRIEEACRRLRNTNDTITEIALAVGFENTRTFNRAFMRNCNITPSDYRKLHKTK